MSVSRAATLAEFFAAHPNVWHDGRTLATIGGAYAWRTRLSDLRRPPFLMTIENRQRHGKTPAGEPFTISEYRFQKEEEVRPRMSAVLDKVQDGAVTPSCGV